MSGLAGLSRSGGRADPAMAERSASSRGESFWRSRSTFTGLLPSGAQILRAAYRRGCRHDPGALNTRPRSTVAVCVRCRGLSHFKQVSGTLPSLCFDEPFLPHAVMLLGVGGCDSKACRADDRRKSVVLNLRKPLSPSGMRAKSFGVTCFPSLRALSRKDRCDQICTDFDGQQAHNGRQDRPFAILALIGLRPTPRGGRFPILFRLSGTCLSIRYFLWKDHRSSPRPKREDARIPPSFLVTIRKRQCQKRKKPRISPDSAASSAAWRQNLVGTLRGQAAVHRPALAVSVARVAARLARAGLAKLHSHRRLVLKATWPTRNMFAMISGPSFGRQVVTTLRPGKKGKPCRFRENDCLRHRSYSGSSGRL